MMRLIYAMLHATAVAILIPASMCLAQQARIADQPNAETVELFSAMESDEIDVKLIPLDEFSARVMIKNNTDKPISVQLPNVFAGVPVLAQNRGGGGGNRGGGGNQQGQTQPVGGGMNGGRGGGGMGFMNVPPEKVGQIMVETLCLEHGKKEPRPAVPYQITPLETVTTQPGVKELLSAYADHALSQSAAQAAVWHLANDLTWEELSSKRFMYDNGTSTSWFTPQEIMTAAQFSNAALIEAERNRRPSPGEMHAVEPTEQSEIHAEAEW